MTARITPAQARKLGIVVPGAKKRTTRKEASGPYWTICVWCGEQFRTRVSEDRHLEATKHPRYELVLEGG